MGPWWQWHMGSIGLPARSTVIRPMIRDRSSRCPDPPAVAGDARGWFDGGRRRLGAFALRLADPWPEMLASRWWLLVAMPITIPIFNFPGSIERWFDIWGLSSVYRSSMA